MKRRTEAAVALIGEDLICHLAKALARARALHPEFATSALRGADAVLDEALELREAAGTESQERQNEEATDVVVTGIRFLNGEYTEEGRRGLEQIFVFDEDLDS